MQQKYHLVFPWSAIPTLSSTLRPEYWPDAARLFQHWRITNMSSIPTPKRIEIEFRVRSFVNRIIEFQVLHSAESTR